MVLELILDIIICDRALGFEMTEEVLLFLSFFRFFPLRFVVYIYGSDTLMYLVLKQINKMIADVDKDGSGAIDFDEFVHMMTAKIGERDTKEELTKAFQIIDLDKNVFTHNLVSYFI